MTMESQLSMTRVEELRAEIAQTIAETPVLKCRWLSARIGRPAVLKAENLQRTGSFKVRGATVKLSRLAGLPQRPTGVVAASAGNHGQAVAFAARSHGIPCTVFMPASAAISKIEAVEAYGGKVIRGGETVDDCVVQARAAAERDRFEFIHPFDDWDVISGQATLGLDLLEQVPEMGTVVIPIGGGGLAGGTAWALKQERPDLRVIGVRVEGSFPDTREGHNGDVHLADGIAVKHPGNLTGPLLDRYVDQLCVVSEDEIAEAMILLMQRSKLVAEGAGAVGIAALLSGQADPAPDGSVVVVLSGGNVDVGVLAAIARRHESLAGRRLHLLTRISDRPGSLAALLNVVARADANVIAAEHQREGIDLHVGETAIELILETDGREHSRRVTEALRDAGYPL